jgi:predicted amidohydrolase YtcJ
MRSLVRIVTALALASLGVSHARAAVGAVYVNGTVITVDASNRIAQAVAVTGDRVPAVGSDAEIQAPAGPGTWLVDLAGKTLVPGFVDAHSHFPESGNTAVYRVDVNSPPIGTIRSIVILSDNPLRVPAEAIKDIRVLETIVGGKPVHKAQ